MMDMAQHFCNASFLKSQIARESWKAIKSLWTLVHVGPPDHLTVDQGSAYIIKEMRSHLETAGVTLHEAVIENSGTIATIERYHAPLRAAFPKLCADLGT